MRATAPAELAERLLAWYDRHRRTLPWRARPGQTADSYHVWLSEIMLQQTTVTAVAGYFGRFVARWPTLADLARAELDEVLHAWQGLGYYARARNLHKCARLVAAEHGGRFPGTEAELRALPGVGAYTAAAIAAIAFDAPATVVDGNVERVIARLRKVEAPLPAAKTELRRLAAEITPAVRPGDYAQAIMDLGATVCTPARPGCLSCPWIEACAARAAGVQEQLPNKPAKRDKPQRHGVAFWAVRADGAVLLRRRPDNGLLGGMMEVPSTEWRPEPWDIGEAAAAAPLAAAWSALPGVVAHGFTHFDIDLVVLAGRVNGVDAAGGVWCLPDRFGDHALPSLTKKVVRHAMAHGRTRMRKTAGRAGPAPDPQSSSLRT